jgi:hypothetical protein
VKYKRSTKNQLTKPPTKKRPSLPVASPGTWSRGSDYFTLRKILLQNVFYILVSNCFSKWRNFIENRLKLTNSLKKNRKYFLKPLKK